MAEEDEVDITANLRKKVEELSKETAYYKKYFALRQKCEQLQQANEKMVNRIQHVKKLIKRCKRDKRLLTSRLDEHGDNFRDVQVPYMWDEDTLINGGRTHSKYPGAGSDSDRDVRDGRSRLEPKSALQSVQSILQSHGLGHSDSKSKKIKVEKEKDPNAPKKPANAFLMFCQTQRATVQEEYLKEHKEEIAHHELTKTLAQQWNVLVPEEKRIYYSMYEKEKERYEREMKSYKPKQEVVTDNVSMSSSSDLTSSSLEISATVIKEEPMT